MRSVAWNGNAGEPVRRLRLGLPMYRQPSDLFDVMPCLYVKDGSLILIIARHNDWFMCLLEDSAFMWTTYDSVLTRTVQV